MIGTSPQPCACAISKPVSAMMRPTFSAMAAMVILRCRCCAPMTTWLMLGKMKEPVRARMAILRESGYGEASATAGAMSPRMNSDIVMRRVKRALVQRFSYALSPACSPRRAISVTFSPKSKRRANTWRKAFAVE